jgi:hypothetical protein
MARSEKYRRFAQACMEMARTVHKPRGNVSYGTERRGPVLPEDTPDPKPFKVYRVTWTGKQIALLNTPRSKKRSITSDDRTDTMRSTRGIRRPCRLLSMRGGPR